MIELRGPGKGTWAGWGFAGLTDGGWLGGP